MNHLKRSMQPDYPSGDFALDEIEWKNHYPVHPELIPFESRTKKIIKELQREKAKADPKLYHY